MLSYDTPLRECYFAPSSAFGATTESQQWIGPKGLTGWVRDIMVYITASMVGTTTVPEITVGSSEGATTYARFRLGTTAIAGYTTATAVRRASIVAADNWDNASLADFAGHVLMRTAVIPADTIFFISRVAGVGGTPAGTGPSWVWIDWY
jgi:hypothetical protein